MATFPLTVPALEVKQPLGTFYAVVLPAEVLLQVSYSDALHAFRITGQDIYNVDGTQRLQQPRRLDAIAEYIDRIDSAFPNSIILAANSRYEDGFIEGDTDDEEAEYDELSKRWRIEESDSGCFALTIPSSEMLAAVIDGQHRLFSFARADKKRLDVELLCAIFIDLPKPLQAQLFATINSTQKPVDKSLTLELFGYNVDDEPASQWSPDKLAVFLARRAGSDEKSPLQNRIIVAPENEFMKRLPTDMRWQVSTAVVVSGIIRLISTNPKRDSNALLTPRRSRSEIGFLRMDKSPLREAYISGNDSLIYSIFLNYLRAADAVFWSKARPNSYIMKTVGVQALLDVLRLIVGDAVHNKDASQAFFESQLSKASHIDFASDRFRNPSGAGRTFIRKIIAANLGLEVDMDDEDRATFVNAGTGSEAERGERS